MFSYDVTYNTEINSELEIKWRFKCCELLQKLRLRLGTCKIDLSPPVILYYRSRAILLWWFLLFYVLEFKPFLSCWRFMYVFVFLYY